MPRHAAPKTRSPRRSASAHAAYRAGLVTNTIELGRPSAYDVRQRANASLIRHAFALGLVGAAFWIYDIGLLVHG
jgi:hypothetical protein